MRNTAQNQKQPARPQSVGRIVAILEVLANRGRGASLSELTMRTGAPKTSLVDLLAGLTAEHCLERDEDGLYRLGPRFLALALQATAGRQLVDLVHPVLVDLAATTGETAVLGALAPEGDLATYLDKAESDNPIRYAVTIGERRALYCTAIGKILLADFSDDLLAAYLKSVARKKFTDSTITRIADLKTELARVRRGGIARTRDERVAGASGRAVAIRGRDGVLAGALLVAGPSARILEKSDQIETHLAAAAERCSRMLGGGAQNHGEAIS